MRRIIRWVAKLYPRAWRERYYSDFDQLLEDIAPSWRDVCDVLFNALAMRAGALVEGTSEAPPLRFAIVFTALVPLMLLSVIAVSSRAQVAPLPRIAWARPPMPPPAPPPPTQITDPRVFFPSAGPQYSFMYSSLPVSFSGSQIVEGVALRFPVVPDIGKVYRYQQPIKRVWPGLDLEKRITRRVIPNFPKGTSERQVVAVFLEYLIGTDGSVKVLKALGPAAFVDSARSALEKWQYRPVRFENQTIEVISRIEVRFDAELARPS